MRSLVSGAPGAGRLLVLFTLLLLVGASTALAGNAVPRGGGGATAAAPVGARVAPGLLAELRAGITDRFVVEFADRADLSRAPGIADFAARGRFVLDTLQAVAGASQSATLDLVAATPGAKAQPFWLRNAIVVHGDAKLASAIARLPGVAEVRPERRYPLIRPVETEAVEILGEAPEWGVARIGAPDVWAEGITGQGVVVANIDTGVQYDHPALVNQYRGNLGDGTFDHAYNWWDPTGICGDSPCDNAGHGTHTMGTIAGGDGPGPFEPDVGVAPGSRWIAAKGCEDVFCTEASLLSAGQFVLAPTDPSGDPESARPDLRADIVNSSWGGGPGDPFYQEIVDSWRAAGIIPVFSAGNSGPGCASGGSPGDYLGAFSVGATDINDEIAIFSSRGPSVYGKVNPDVSAPGVDVVSSVPGGGYAAFDGTSMAAPHTAGALALVLSAEPDIIGQVDAATDAVRGTALDIIDQTCGGDEDGDPNNVFGDGLIDAAAAVALVATGGTLSGAISDDETGQPIGGATVSAFNGQRTFSAVTDADGAYNLFLAEGSYVVTVEAFGYEVAVASDVTIVADETTTLSLALTPLPRFVVSGVVTAAESGDPLERATVVAIGTPVPPAVTDADGAYELELPLGSYTLRAAQGGCSESAFTEIELFEPLTVDFALSRKLDDFGHGCRPIGFDWLDAEAQTALYGDEFAGRLRLPFAFPFYGETYSQVFLSDNGYLNFEGPDQFNPSPVAIPTPNPPNAAIYLLWQDMRIDEVGAIEHALIGTEPLRAFVIEYSDVRAGSATLDLEVKLWEDGRIDLLYGDNPANPGDGRMATIGIENAAGDDALQFGFFEGLVTPNSAFRYQEMPTGVVTGTVTNANDGLPVEGATVSALPGTRSTETADDGTYSLRLLPGSYTLRFAADGYTTVEMPITIAAGDELVRDVALEAPIASVQPLEVNVATELGETATATVEIANTGTAPLEWAARERDRGSTPPDLPTIDRLVRPSTWAPAAFPRSLPVAEVEPLASDQLDVIIEDPAGDALGAVDITTVRGGASEGLASMAIDLTDAAGANQAVGFVFLDTDQDPATGLPPEAFFGLPTQDVGMEYFVDLFAIHDPDPVAFVVDALTFELVAIVPASVDSQTIAFDVPLEALAGDDGAIDVAMALGDFFGPTDWAPDVGHGTIEPFSDAEWLAVDPTEGTVAPDETTELTLTLGGPDTGPGEHRAELVIVSNDPRQGAIPVSVTLTVALPESFGAAAGMVTEAHSGAPLPATVTLNAERDGMPFVVSTTAGADGAWQLFGPAGAWPADVTLDGHVPTTFQVTIAAGVTTPGQDVSLHREQPHATLDGPPLEFELLEGQSTTATLLLGNPDGHAELTFEIGEVNLDAGPTLEASAAARPLPAQGDSLARTPRDLFASSGVPVPPRGVQGEGDVLTSWPTGLALPWGVGFTGDVWLSDPIDLLDVRFTTAGERQSEFGVPVNGDWGGDMAYDPGRGWLWQVNVGGDNGLYGIDPSDGSVQLVITGSPWSGISQRGVAYDPASDTFYVGGWNEGIVYRVAGPSWPEPGETLSQCQPPDPNISGLAWNPAFGLLWEATNSDVDTIWLIDPATCEALRALPHPDPSGFTGAGIEIDVVGNLWTVSQNSGRAYLIESGLPNFSDIPWLTVEPVSGSVPIDGSADLTVTVDSTGLAPGVYRGMLVVQTNDPNNAAMTVPAMLTVPAYRQGVNAGGGEHVTAGGTAYAADRAYGSGPFGYVGPSSPRSTTAPIDGTDEDALYQRLRSGMTAYRFDLPDGHYRVDLSFAEIQSRRAGARIFSVMLEGATVLANLDVYAEAGGRNVALDRSFIVEVTDGTLDVGFVAQRGDTPIVNAILVTDVP